MASNCQTVMTISVLRLIFCGLSLSERRTRILRINLSLNFGSLSAALGSNKSLTNIVIHKCSITITTIGSLQLLPLLLLVLFIVIMRQLSRPGGVGLELLVRRAKRKNQSSRLNCRIRAALRGANEMHNLRGQLPLQKN